MEELLACELEALEALFEGTEAVPAAEGAWLVSLPLLPRSCPPHQRFCSARLEAAVPATYPSAEPLALQLRDCRGLADAAVRELEDSLRKVAAQLAGEAALGELAEAALGRVEALNRPAGACPVCLEVHASGAASGPAAVPVADAASSEAATQSVALPCGHALHASCVLCYWAWFQADARERAEAIRGDYGALAPARLAQAGLESGDAGFSGACLVCRAPLEAESMAELVRELGSRRAAGDAARACAPRASVGFACTSQGLDSVLPREALAALRATQRQHDEGLARQRARGGLVSTSAVDLALGPAAGPLPPRGARAGEAGAACAEVALVPPSGEGRKLPPSSENARPGVEVNARGARRGRIQRGSRARSDGL